jgi:hypothetical protein
MKACISRHSGMQTESHDRQRFYSKPNRTTESGEQLSVKNSYSVR